MLSRIGRRADQFGCSLGDHDDWRVAITGADGRHNGSIHHAQSLDAEHAQLMEAHLHGNGAAATPTIEEDLAQVRAAGFEVRGVAAP